MIRSTKGLALVGLLAAGIAVAIGCQKKYVPPPIDTAAITGNWIELVEEAPTNPRVPPPTPKKYLRHLTINADKTFEYTLQPKPGQPAEKGKADGTWEVRAEGDGQMLYFNVTQNTFGEHDPEHEGAPVSTVGVRMREVSGRGKVDVMDVEDLAGEATAYVRE